MPEKQREDIAKELRGLIEDMLAQREGNAQTGDADIEAVLTELGEPSALAAKYSGKPRHLIGPELFELYIIVLKIALAASVFGILVAMAVHYAVTPPQYIGEVFSNIFDAIFSGLMEAFAWVTIVFALIEHFSVDINAAKRKRARWKPSDLPEIPVKGALIKPSGPIVGIIFIAIFFILINFAPGLFSVYFSKAGASPIPVFSLSVLKSYMLLINIWFAVAIFKEIMKLVCGRYNISFAVANVLLGSISFVLAMIIFSNFQIWNWNIASYLERIYGNSLSGSYNVSQIMTIAAKAFLGVIIFSYAVDMISTVAKAIRYNAPDFKRMMGMGK
ncbi:MAG: hypothetical protein P4L75_03365 [Clostridia bacterium]|nr:hypothetical protein [Clostridia bacterium]